MTNYNNEQKVTISGSNQQLLRTLSAIIEFLEQISQQEIAKEITNNLLTKFSQLPQELKKHIHLVSILLLDQTDTFLKDTIKALETIFINIQTNHKNNQTNIIDLNSIINIKNLIDHPIKDFTSVRKTLKSELPDPNNQDLLDETKMKIIHVQNRLKSIISNLNKTKQIIDSISETIELVNYKLPSNSTFNSKLKPYLFQFSNTSNSDNAQLHDSKNQANSPEKTSKNNRNQKQ